MLAPFCGAVALNGAHETVGVDDQEREQKVRLTGPEQRRRRSSDKEKEKRRKRRKKKEFGASQSDFFKLTRKAAELSNRNRLARWAQAPPLQVNPHVCFCWTRSS